MTKLKIKVTKDVLYKARFCGINSLDPTTWTTAISSNCAIALAVRSIWPKAAVMPGNIYTDPIFIPSGFNLWIVSEGNGSTIPIPKEASEFISTFDSANTYERLKLAEFEFEVEVRDEVINEVNIEEIRELLVSSKTLELCEL